MLTPLLFAPRLKDKIWGGSKLKSLFDKPATGTMVGESWELSGYEGDESVVVNGPLAGNNLRELIEVYMGDLVGDEVFDLHGHSFPLLFKLIDANENLSIQVHPGDEVASDRHHSYGKTEMWYVVDADPGAELIIGFKEDCSRDTYLDALDAGTVEELLQHVPVTKGDVFFIPAGLVHAIGKGVVVAEIQQSSDVTYRIYDYKRKDAEGNERELHTDEALDVIDFTAARSPKTRYDARLNTLTPLVSCEYFNTGIIKLDEPLHRNYGNIGSFVAYMCLEGALELVSDQGSVRVKAGDTVLVPALIDEVQLLPEGETVLLEVFVPEA
ncbi:MAG: class I mannose-6-phosphate isomerase [Bacteroidales bacterium]|nr:class I mannose-6-phosphate isomerase [Bacteroidales bacterium]OJX90479.1 MAG: mannose-6-phosphate isomerase [Paludibacter sp. 47-17]